ncbi:MAG: imidazoleglycerol-phosphate dehydratase HisB, partial [Pseudomonadota bacterium]
VELLIRTFCESKEDNIIICPPTFPIYAIDAKLSQIDVREAPLTKDFQLDLEKIESVFDSKTKLIFVCSPNNPTGNILNKEDILTLCERYKDDSLIIVDETYVEFTDKQDFLNSLDQFDNLVLLRTMSKSFASAGLRCGTTIAHKDIIALMRKMLAVYPIPIVVAQEVEKILSPKNQKRMEAIRQETLITRDWFNEELQSVSEIEKIYPSDANYILIKVRDAKALYKKCTDNGFIIRDQSSQLGLENCLRISIGTRSQMEQLLAVLKDKRIEQKPQRTANIYRNTKETKISVAINLDQDQPVKINTGIGFYDHMLEQIARHGGFSMIIDCDGDLEIDNHHTIEDCAIALGQALKEALGDKRGIGRYGFSLPMDEAQASVLIDLSGRYFLKFEADFPDKMLGDMPVDLVEHIYRSLAENLQMNCHVKIEGDNTHHMVESSFKALGRALRQAIKIDGNAEALPSTKGTL